MESILSNNDNIKPNIARLMFDSYPVSSQKSSNKDLPYECVSHPGDYILDDFPLYHPNDYDDTDVANTTSIAHMSHPASNSTAINNLHNNYNNLPWSPSLNQIQEESSYDISYSNDSLHYIPTNSRKRQQFRSRREIQHHRKIAASIHQLNGIYKANLIPAQEDNGANRTCTNNKQLLVHFQDITPYPINGVNSDGPALHCTGIGYLP